MARKGSHYTEHGATTLEFVALAGAVGVLLGTVGIGLASHGGSIGRTIGDRLGQLVRSERPEARARDTGEQFVSGRAMRSRHSARGAQEIRVGGGDAPARVSRDDLRLSPIIHPIAAWRDTAQRSDRFAGIGVHLESSACALCLEAGWTHALQAGMSTDRSGASRGVGVDVAGDVHAALASLEIGARLTRSFGAVKATVQGRGRALVGGDVTGRAKLDLSEGSQGIDARAGAMAGAVAHAEGTAGVSLLGVSIEQAGEAEGWAGAGIRGTAVARHEHGRVTWKLGWGAALGLGGAASWSGSIDVSQVPARHRAFARSLLASSIAAANPAFASFMTTSLIRH